MKNQATRPQAFFSLLLDLWTCLSTRRKKQFLVLAILMFFGGLAEAVSLGLVVPFLAVMAAPERITTLPVIQPWIRAGQELVGVLKPLGWSFPAGPAIIPWVFAVLFACSAIVTGSYRLLLLWAGTRFGSLVGADLSGEVYERCLHQPYSIHVRRSSSTVIRLVEKGSYAVTVCSSVLGLLTSVFVMAFIILTLFLVSPWTTFISGTILGLCYATLARAGRQALLKKSRVIAEEQNQILKALQEGLGAIRDILLDGTQALYVSIFRKSDVALRRAGADVTVLGQSPRFIMEAIGMVLFSILALFLSGGPKSLENALPVLGALALGVQRLLPAMQQGYTAWTSIVACSTPAWEVIRFLQEPGPDWARRPPPPSMSFCRQISFDSVKFRYSANGPWILDGVSFTVPKGSRVGFVGKTGSGKSTCVDLLMGLLEPDEGRILIDETALSPKNVRSWQRNLAHVPQAIYLSDCSLAENIALGVPVHEIDMNRVRVAARQAQIADFIESSSEGYQALVGERGIRLSGGQRQRIGIARALYKKAQVLIFDEATSALDQETEAAVMEAIQSLSSELTILLIAHRVSTLKNCDQIIECYSQTHKTSSRNLRGSKPLEMWNTKK